MGLRRRSAASSGASSDGSSNESVSPEFVRIADAPFREPTTVLGRVVRMRTQPGDGPVSLEITIEDPSGTAIVHWSGRRSIGGVGLGRRILVHGVASSTPRGPRFMNPAYTLMPAR